MKLFHRPASWVAVTARMRPYSSAERHHAHWLLALALVLGAAVAGPSLAGTISPRRLLEVTELGNPAISPDGRYVAFRSERASLMLPLLLTGA